jgi:hypothetical protein
MTAIVRDASALAPHVAGRGPGRGRGVRPPWRLPDRNTVSGARGPAIVLAPYRIAPICD